MLIGLSVSPQLDSKINQRISVTGGPVSVMADWSTPSRSCFNLILKVRRNCILLNILPKFDLCVTILCNLSFYCEISANNFAGYDIKMLKL